MLALAACVHRGANVVSGSGSPCPRGDPLRGVYHPWRLRVLGTCVTFRGTLRDSRPEPDGDHHLYVVPAAGDERFLDPKSRGYGDLVVELMPGQRLPIPNPGDRVVFVGT